MLSLPIDEVVTRLQNNCLALISVLRALSFALPPGYPAAYVFQLAERSDPNVLIGAHHQRVMGIIGVEIMARNASRVGTGGPAAQDLDAHRMSVMMALKGWSPSGDFTPFDFVRGDLISYKEGLIIWRDQYSTIFYR